MYRQILMFSAIATPFVAGAQVDASAAVQDTLHPVSLPEAVSLAQRNAPAAVQARGQLRTAASAVRLAYGAFVPSLSVSMNQTQQSGQRFDALRNQVVSVTQPWSYSTGVSSSLELFDGGRRFADLRARRADEDAAEANEITRSEERRVGKEGRE